MPLLFFMDNEGYGRRRKKKKLSIRNPEFPLRGKFGISNFQRTPQYFLKISVNALRFDDFCVALSSKH
jgi:hypothetical protein